MVWRKPDNTGKDLIAQAQSGTGKTGCSATGALQIIDTEFKVNDKNVTQILILAPTHRTFRTNSKCC